MRSSKFEKRTAEEAACPQCGGEAIWVFGDEAETVVDIQCADCGGTRMTREEFDCHQTDMPGSGEAETS